MKFKTIFASLIFFGLLFSSHNTFAQATPKVSKKQVKQQVRIKHGLKNGELTKREAVALQKQQRHIQRSKKRAKADGVVTPRERARLHKKQTRANRNIRRQKNDAQSRN